MKGIVLAGGKGSRLYPMTKVVSKQLLPLYDKPMIYYPLSVLMLGGIKDILIISTPEDIDNYIKLLGDGIDLGIKISYKIQLEPKGLAEAFILGEDFIGNDSVCLILGDNIFYGQDLIRILVDVKNNLKGATVFGYPVMNPKDFGVVEFDKDFNIISIEEKPAVPKSNYVIPGLYFYNNDVIEISKNIKPSDRGELEITAVNNEYLRRKELKVSLFGRGLAWLDTGTPQGMLKASEFIEAIQARQGFYIACLEEIAYRKGYISKEQLKKLGETLKMTDYGKYILSIAEEKQ
jgi:glucose-1-phosphate thymidylyltransferase